MAEYQTPEFHPAFEEYCEAIWELKEDEVAVIQARVAERLGVSRPAVSEMIKRMQAEGFVALDGSTINLTEDGLRLAEQVVRRHRLAERLLTDILGLSWADAHVEAGRVGARHLRAGRAGHQPPAREPDDLPARQPHPGSSYAPPDLVALSEIPVGDGFTVIRIPEELEFTPGLLEFLEGAAVQPGTPVSSRRCRPTARPPSRSTGATWASGRSPPAHPGRGTGPRAESAGCGGDRRSAPTWAPPPRPPAPPAPAWSRTSRRPTGER